MAYELVVVGVSAGGLQALCTIAGALTVDFSMAMVIVQHRSKDSDALCDVLQDCTSLPMRDITDKEPITDGPYASAAVSNIRSMEGRLCRMGSSTEREKKPASTRTW